MDGGGGRGEGSGIDRFGAGGKQKQHCGQWKRCRHTGRQVHAEGPAVSGVAAEEKTIFGQGSRVRDGQGITGCSEASDRHSSSSWVHCSWTALTFSAASLLCVDLRAELNMGVANLRRAGSIHGNCRPQSPWGSEELEGLEEVEEEGVPP